MGGRIPLGPEIIGDFAVAVHERVANGQHGNQDEAKGEAGPAKGGGIAEHAPQDGAERGRGEGVPESPRQAEAAGRAGNG